MNIETIETVEFGEMMRFLMERHGKTWDEVESEIPNWVYEEDFWLHKDGGNSDGEIFEPLRNYLNSKGIERVKVYHDN